MNHRRVVSLLTILALTAGLLFVPAMAFAGSDDAGTDIPPTQPATEQHSDTSTTSHQPFEATTSHDAERAEQTIFSWDSPEPHWMWLVARNAVWGGMLGGLIGFGTYLVTGLQMDPWIIAHFAGGGILVGAATGLIEAAFWTDPEAQDVDRPASVDWVQRDMPRTYQLNLLNIEY